MTNETRARTMANRIRIMAMGCESRNVMSCKFGNEFGANIQQFILDELEEVSADMEPVREYIEN